jgi:L-rhamnose mutarotase
MRKLCFALDLKDDPQLIAEYERLHLRENERPEITKSIAGAGILNMEIFRTGNRLFMIMETTDDFDAAKKQEMDAGNPAVVEWEDHVSQFQQPLPWAQPGQKWILMNKIYELPK